MEYEVDIKTNQRWYCVLQEVTNEEPASHLVMAHEDTSDGCSTWYAMKEWHARKVVLGDIVKTARAKLDVLDQLPKGDVNCYISEI